MKITFIIFLVFGGLHLNAQTLPNFDLIKLEKASDYKAADPFALQTATYLLSIPIKKDDKDRLNSLQFISKWMYGTPDYSFMFRDAAAKLAKDNDDLVGIYVAAMVKYTLENKAASKDPKLVKVNTLILMLNYCENKNNNVKMTKQLKKLEEAKEKGQLEQAFD